MALLGAFSLLITDSEAKELEALEARFETRATLSGSFTENFVADLAASEIAQAERLLAAPEVTQLDFEAVVQSFGFEAAVLLDAQGDLVHVWPATPEMIDRDMTDYAHLRAALTGRVGVSDVVPSAAEGVPIVAVAVPFRSASGRRVFSGAFTPATTPVSAYLGSAVPIRGGAAFLMDSSGAVLASPMEHGLAGEIANLPNGVSNVETPAGQVTAAIDDVPGLPWRVVLTAPTKELYAPVSGPPWASWLLVAFAVTSAVAVGLFHRLGRAQAAAEGAARTDHLTGLQNRRSMQESLDHGAAMADRYGTPFAALMIDIDRFKRINDAYGHDVGDTVICSVATALTDAIREGDRAARWGGEEFLVLLHHADRESAVVVAQRIRLAIAATAFPAALADLELSVSIGVADLRDGDTEQLLHRSDAALYTAKANGRNCVELATRLVPATR